MAHARRNPAHNDSAPNVVGVNVSIEHQRKAILVRVESDIFSIGKAYGNIQIAQFRNKGGENRT